MDPGNWQAANRMSSQDAAYVAPGDTVVFVVQLRAPSMPGEYRVAVRPVIDGATWLEDYGAFLIVYVEGG